MKNASNTDGTSYSIQTESSNILIITVLQTYTECSQKGCPCHLKKTTTNTHKHRRKCIKTRKIMLISLREYLEYHTITTLSDNDVHFNSFNTLECVKYTFCRQTALISTLLKIKAILWINDFKIIYNHNLRYINHTRQLRNKIK